MTGLTQEHGHSSISMPGRAVETSPRSLAGLAHKGLYAAFLAVLALSPFEAGYPPMTRFFRATFTNLELLLLLLTLMLAITLAVSREARDRLIKMPLLLPMLALIGASLISYAFGEHRSQGINSTYRLLMGAVVFASAWLCLRSGRRLLTALGCLVAAASVSSLAGLLEYAPWFNVEPVLAAFKPMPTTVGGTVRLSGTFEYANGAAMFFELVLPLVLSMATLFSSGEMLRRIRGFSISERSRKVLQASLFGLCGVVGLALLLTMSRAALAGFVAGVGAFFLVGLLRRRSLGPFSRTYMRSIAIAVGVIGVGALYVYFTQPMFRLRLVTENDRGWYRVAYAPGPVPAQLPANEVITVPMTLRNTGPMVWRSSGALVIHLGYHWRSADKGFYSVFEGVRTPLPHDVEPGGSVSVMSQVLAPPKPGVYYLEWDMAQEHYTWFSAKSPQGAELVRVDVGAPLASHSGRVVPKLPAPMKVDTLLNSDTSTVGRTQLWKVALRMFVAHPLTGVGPDGFRNLYGEYAGVTDWNRNIYTNNTYIEFFTNMGLLGGFAFVWLGVAGLVRGVRNALREPVGARWLLGVGALSSVLAFYLHGLGDYFLFSTPMYTIFWLLLSICALWPLMPREIVRPVEQQEDEGLSC